MNLLRFSEEAFALGMAKRLVELNFEVVWEPSAPGEVLYRQAPNMPHPRELKPGVRPVELWFEHGVIDTRPPA